ncbi:MAG TPA: mannosyltransferase family protein [Polyangiaceae bacterium]|nr:mannosyltransferase family protein [Polyangiaceae bacterium]
MDESAKPDAPRGTSSAWTLVALYALAWGLPAFIGGYALLTMFEFHPLPVPDFIPLSHVGVARLVFDPWQHWDGQWYLRIAALGYYRYDASTAFLPVYPWLIRGLAPFFGGDILVAGCVASWGAFAAALWFLWDLLRAELGDELALSSLVLLVTFPTAFFFHAVYTESIFLLFVAVALWSARRGRFVTAGLAGLAASLTRWTGFAVVPALFVEGFTQVLARDAGATEIRLSSMLTRDSLRALSRVGAKVVVSTLLPLLAFPVVQEVLEKAVGDPWAFSRAQRFWERRLTPPWVGIIDGIRVLLPGHLPYLEPLPGGFPRLPDYPGGFLEAHAYNLVAALGGLALSVVAVRRLRPSLAVFALVGVVLPLMTPSRLQPLQSMPRFVVVLFPLFAALALLVQKRPLLGASAIAIGAALQGFFVARFTLWFWVA